MKPSLDGLDAGLSPSVEVEKAVVVSGGGVEVVSEPATDDDLFLLLPDLNRNRLKRDLGVLHSAVGVHMGADSWDDMLEGGEMGGQKDLAGSES